MELRNEYLQDRNVEPFVEYMANHIGGVEQPLQHRFVVRDKALGDNVRKRLRENVLEIQSLEDAFAAYWWAGEDFGPNHLKLLGVQAKIRDAINCEDTPKGDERALCAVDAVLEWGAGGKGPGLYRKNMQWANVRKNQRQLVSVLAAGRAALRADSAEPTVFCGSNGVGPRMNAGFTKYYALAADELIIYDGRVGAALGLLVRKYCEKSGEVAVSEPLHFRWGAQYSVKKGGGLNRNPTKGVLEFKPLPTSGGAEWAKQMLRASWLLEAARKSSGAQWCAGEDGLRKIEAALFTMGYSLDQVQ